MGFIIRVVVYTLALLVAAHVVPGISLAGLTSALVAGLGVGVVNAGGRALPVGGTFSLTLLTLRLFLLVLNAVCPWLGARFGRGLHPARLRAGLLGRPAGERGELDPDRADQRQRPGEGHPPARLATSWCETHGIDPVFMRGAGVGARPNVAICLTAPERTRDGERAARHGST